MSTYNNIQKRLFQGTGMQAYSQVVRTFIRIVEIPLWLHYFGVNLYGEWLMLIAIPAYLAIADGGFAEASVRDMNIRSSSGDQTGALAIFQSTSLLLMFLSMAMLLITAPILYFLPISDWFAFQQITPTELKIVLGLFILRVLISFHGNLINGVFWCTGHYPLSMFLAATTQLLEFTIVASVMLLGGGVVSIAGGYLGTRLLCTLLIWNILKSKNSWINYGFKSASFGMIRYLYAPALASLAFPLSNALNIQGMRLVVGFVIGPTAVVLFTALRTLSNIAMQPRFIVNRLIQPELGVAFGSSDKNLFDKIFLHSCQITLWISIVAVGFLLLIGNWLWLKWTGGKLELQWQLFYFLISSALLNAIWNTALMVPYATNRHIKSASVYTIVYGIGAVILGYILVRIYGLAGAGIALLIVEVLMAGYVLPTALKMSNVTWAAWAAVVTRPPFFILKYIWRRAVNYMTN